MPKRSDTKLGTISTRPGLYLLAASVFLALAHTSLAGSLSWNVARVSQAINQGNVDVAVRYFPAVIPAGPNAISRVHASVSYTSQSIVQTRLCWNGQSRCVPVTGNTINTHAFNGLSADKPMYLVHVAQGKGPLPSPAFIQGNVIVWFTPAAHLSKP